MTDTKLSRTEPPYYPPVRVPPVYAVRTGILFVAILAVCVLSNLSPVMMGGGTPDTGGGSVARQILYLLVVVLVLFGLRPTVRPDRLLAVPLGLVLALTWSAASVIWAIEPSVAIRRFILTAMIIWLVCASVRAAGYERTVLAIRIVLALSLLANYLVAVFLPGLGVHQYETSLDRDLVGSWCGFMTQKNYAGVVGGVTILVFLFNARDVRPYLRYPIIVAAAYFLYRTGSRTSMSATLAAISLGAVYGFYNARFRSVVVGSMALAVVVAAMLSYVYVDPWQLLTGNDVLLSGRNQIWQLVWRYSMDHWILGAGFGSFWDIGPAGPAYRYGKGWLWTIIEGHNGYLDLLATIGVPGLVLVITGTIVAPLTRLLLSRMAGGQRGALPCAMIIFTVAHNGGESTLFDRDSISWMFMLLAIALVLVATPDLKVRFARARRDRTLLRSFARTGSTGVRGDMPPADG